MAAQALRYQLVADYAQRPRVNDLFSTDVTNLSAALRPLDSMKLDSSYVTAQQRAAGDPPVPARSQTANGTPEVSAL